MPVSAAAKLTPVMPMSARKNSACSVYAAHAVSSSRSAGSFSAGLGAQHVTDLRQRLVNRGQDHVRRPLAGELHDVLAEVGLHRMDARGFETVAEVDLLGCHRLGLHDGPGIARERCRARSAACPCRLPRGGRARPGRRACVPTCRASHRGRRALALGSRRPAFFHSGCAAAVGRGMQAAVEIAQRVLQIRIGDRSVRSWKSLPGVVMPCVIVSVRCEPAARRSAMWMGSGPPPACAPAARPSASSTRGRC